MSGEQADQQIQQIIAEHQDLAADLISGMNADEALETLASITQLSEEQQLSLLKALAATKTEQAADIAFVLHTYSPVKAVRKEARRTMIKLQSASIYPQWEPEPIPSFSSMLEDFTMADQGDSTDEESHPPLISMEKELNELRGMLMGKPAESAITNFLYSWVDGRFDEAYSLLSKNSPLRQGLSRGKWMHDRKHWHARSRPHTLKIGFTQTSQNAPEQHTVVEVGWSVAYDGPVDNAPPELPQPTLAYIESGRRWFWSSYTLLEENGKQRIMDMMDEGAHASQLPAEELEQRLSEIAALAAERYQQLEDEASELEEDLNDLGEEDLDEVTEEDEDNEEEEDEESDDLTQKYSDMLQGVQEAFQVTTIALHYSDALIAQGSANDPALYQQAYDHAGVTRDPERGAVYAQLMAEHFPVKREMALSMLGAALLNISDLYEAEEEDEQASRYTALGEQTLRAAFNEFHDPNSTILLAQLLVKKKSNLDEAEVLLQQLVPANLDITQQMARALGLSIVVERKGRLQEALDYVQSVETDFPEIIARRGHLQLALGKIDEAESNLLLTLEKGGENEETYVDLAQLYLEHKHDQDKAGETLEEALQLYPDSGDLIALQGIFNLREGNLDEANGCLEDAEISNPDSRFVHELRALLAKEEQP